jgi:hypothetical protein
MSEIADFGILSGDWMYRSFINTTQPAQQLSDILFGEGDLTLSVGADGFFQSSTLSFGTGYGMHVFGQAVAQNDNTFSQPRIAVEMKAFGIEGEETTGWLYEYRGYLVPNWYNGVDQATVIVGTVIRVLAHGAGSPAGVVASFAAVKKS